MSERSRRTIYLADDQWSALAELARANDTSVNWVVRQAIGQYLTAKSADPVIPAGVEFHPVPKPGKKAMTEHVPQAVPPVAVPASPPAPTTPEDGGVDTNWDPRRETNW